MQIVNKKISILELQKMFANIKKIVGKLVSR